MLNSCFIFLACFSLVNFYIIHDLSSENTKIKNKSEYCEELKAGIQREAVFYQEFQEEFSANLQKCKIIETKNSLVTESEFDVSTYNCDGLEIPIGVILADGISAYRKEIVLTLKDGRINSLRADVFPPNKIVRILTIGGKTIWEEENDIFCFE